MSIINAHPLLAAAGADGGYQISRSVRLRSSASAYFNRTFAAGSQTTWTFSIWFKLGTLGVNRVLISCGSGATDSIIYINTGNTLFLNLDNVTCRASTQVFRDPSAWYHLVVALDTSNATAQNRIRAYINGVEITSWVTNNTIAQNATPSFNSAIAHNISLYTGGGGLSFDGYLTETNWINGQALTPSSFGETNAVTGVWQPKKYGGTYGTNGFYLNFSDNSAVTTSSNVGIGKDFSGNGNYWTSNSISVTAGVTYDSMLDVPTLYADGGNGRGNYAVLNPLDKTSISPTYSNGNLAISAGASWAYSRATMLLPSNVKIYAETTLGSNTNGTSAIQSGFARAGFAMGTNGYYVNHDSVGQIYTAGSLTASGLGALVAGDVIQFAYDGAGNAWIGKNNVWWNSSGGTTGNPATGANPTFTGLSAYDLFISTGNYSNSQNINFGQRPFSYTPPTGFVALNTQNLPTPTISNGASYMAATTYTGTGSALSVSNAVNGVSFQPDFVWTKPRSTAVGHTLFDSLRGVTKYLQSNTTGAEGTAATSLTAFNSDGFTVNSDTSTGANGVTYIGWQWNAGGSTVTNTSGTISAQVRANATAGFSVVTYTGTGANATVGHGLGVAPKLILFKNRASTNAWCVYHSSISPANFLQLDTSAQLSATTYPMFGTTPTAATSTVFSIGTNPQTNAASTFVAYCFAAVAGYSAFGSYTGNGSADGPFVFTGFRPRWILVKSAGNVSQWILHDTSRNTYNVANSSLYPNLANAETTPDNPFDMLSNGFKIRTASGSSLNDSGLTYIFAAFSEVGFKYALGR